MDPGRTREALRGSRWFALLFITRMLGAGVAIGLLLAHQVTDHDPALALLAATWTATTLLAFGQSAAIRTSPIAWLADTLAALGLVLLTEDWRSPFYLFALTTLVLPATTLPWRRALAWGSGFSAAYGVTALLTRQVPADTIDNTIRLETLATHLAVPMLVTIALAYSGALLRHLRAERERSERLAIQTERQRIAWELHDSAKQRVHAAHLLLSAIHGRLSDGDREVSAQALAELRAATADMETSIAELRAPVDGRPVDELLRERAAELGLAGGTRVEVEGVLPAMAPLVSAHTYRIAAEALTNAVRHARSATIRVRLRAAPGGGGSVVVEDDGVGLDSAPGHEGHGLRSMRGRAETIGAQLHIGPGPGGRGTRVALALPDPSHDPRGAA